MTRERAERLAEEVERLLAEADVAGCWVETDFALDAGRPAPDGWYVRIEKAEDDANPDYPPGSYKRARGIAPPVKPSDAPGRA